MKQWQRKRRSDDIQDKDIPAMNTRERDRAMLMQDGDSSAFMQRIQEINCDKERDEAM